MKNHCAEPLVWVCQACSHSFQESEWMEAGRICPACTNKTGRWKCSLCQGDFVQPFLEKEHPCLKSSCFEKAHDGQSINGLKSKKILAGLAIALLLLGLVGTVRYFNQPTSSSIQESNEVRSHSPRLKPPAESQEETGAPTTEIVIRWSDLKHLGQDSEWEPDGTWFVLWEGVIDPPSITSLYYVGLIRQGETRASFIQRIIQNVDPDFREKQNLFASWGSVVGHDTALGSLLDSDASLLAVCKGIAQKAGQNPATRPRNYDGMEQSFDIGLIQPVVLGIDLLNFPTPPWDRINLNFKLKFK